MIKLELDSVWLPLLEILQYVVLFVGYAIIIIISGLLKLIPEQTLKQSLTRIKWLLGGILIVLILLLGKK